MGVKKDFAQDEAEDIKQLRDDLRRLDEQSADHTKKMTIYSKNRFIFLLQSFLLGMSYSMIWPTIYTYIRDGFTMDYTYTKFIYGVTYVSYPVASMLSAYLVENMRCTTKHTIMLLNCFEIIGNLTYTLNYYPFLPCLGRFVAGLGDAFYVVLMKEMKTKYGSEISERVTLECLGSFIGGVILAPGINILTRFIHFKIGYWHLDSNNYPGLTLAVLFMITQFIILIFLSDDGCINKTEKLDDSNSSDSNNSSIMISDYPVLFIAAFSFLYTYIVASIELMIPLIVYEICQVNDLQAMLLYAVIGTLYGMILMFTMTVSFKHPMETYLGITIFMQVVSVLAMIYVFNFHHLNAILLVVAVGIMVFALTSMWSNDDILFINFVQTMVPYEYRKTTHNLRKVMSRLAFCIAGVTIPFCFIKTFIIVGPILIVLVFFLFCCCMVLKYYWNYQYM